MTDSPTRQNRVVLRGISGFWYLAITAVVAVLLIGDAAVRGAWDVVALAAPWAALVLWLMYLVLVRPALIVEPGVLRIRNLLREHVIPWDDIDAYTTRLQLTVILNDGRKISAWGAPPSSVGRPRPQLGKRDEHSLPPARADDLILDARTALGPVPPPVGGGVQTHWQLSVVIITVVLVALCIGTLIF